jgi:CO/xanthine dehydrogenase FAD-binding subunit
MRSFVPEYEMVTARNLDEALALLPEWKPFAGGTDLMVLFEAGTLSQRHFVNIWPLAELKGIDATPDHVTLGALTTYTEVQRHEVLRREFPMLCRAAAETGGIAIQNRGTLGGNIVNASPAADSPPALLAYGAEIELTSRGGSRWIAYDRFHTGYKQMDLRPDELLTRIRLRREGSNAVHYYRKVGTRKAQAISKICFAGYARRDRGILNEIRIGLGSVAPTAIRSRNAERVIRGRSIDAKLIEAARQAILGDISPIDDIRSTFEYRTRVTANLMEDFLSQLSQP